jgi:hypothetical protein
MSKVRFRGQEHSVGVRMDRTVLLDGKPIGYVYGEVRNWTYRLDNPDTTDGPWFTKQEAAEMCARAHLKANRD